MLAFSIARGNSPHTNANIHCTLYFTAKTLYLISSSHCALVPRLGVSKDLFTAAPCRGKRRDAARRSTILYSLNSEPWRLASICKEAADWLRRSPALTLMADQFACLSEKYFCILFYSSLHIRDSQFWLKPLDSDVKTGKCHQRYVKRVNQREEATLHSWEPDVATGDAEEPPYQVFLQ